MKAYSMIPQFRRNSVACSVIGALLSGAAGAQAVSSTSSDENKNLQVLGEIVVTAQRREESAQDVPIAISAFSESLIAAARLDTGPELVRAVPNTIFSKSYFGGFNVQIRGVGTQLGTASADSGVGIHMNNVPLTSSRFFEAEMYDTERVEVLRGPQGTLYGRNATGGVVNVITATPTNEFGGNLSGELANYRSYKVKGALNVPLIDNSLALRLAGSYLKRSGFGTNLHNGDNVDGRDLYSTRATLLFKPTDSIKATLMWQHFEERDDRSRTGALLCNKDSGPKSVNGVAVTDPIVAGLLSQGCSNASLYSAGVHGTPNSIATIPGLLTQLFGFTNGDYFAGKMLSNDLHDTDSVLNPRYKASNDIETLNVDMDVSDRLRLTSLTSYYEDQSDARHDFVGAVPSMPFNNTAFTPGGFFTDPQLGTLNSSNAYDDIVQPSRQFSQELRLQSSFSGPFNFAVGANYVKFNTVADVNIAANAFTLGALVSNGGAPCAVGNPACVYIESTPNANSGLGHNYFLNRTPYQLLSRAAFGELYFNATQDLKFTLGARYTHDHKSQQNLPVTLLTPGSGLKLGTPPILVADFKEPTGRIGFDWKLHTGFTDETLLYGFFSRGYKAGGPNSPAAVGVSVQANYSPEFVNAFELGLKNTLLDGRLVLNLSAFSYDYKDYQIATLVNRVLAVQNIDAQVHGVEVESLWAPINNLEFGANLGYLNTKIKGGASADPMNLTGGDPNLTLVKSSAAANCVTSTAALANLIAIIEQQPGAPVIAGVSGNPAALLGVCSGAYAGLGIIPSDGALTSLNGKQLPNAPKWTASLSAQYGWQLLTDWKATLRFDYYAQAASYARIYNGTVDKLKQWDTTNSTFTVGNKDKGWEVQLFIKNIFDNQPITNTFVYDAAAGLTVNAFTIEPRVFGANVTKRF